ncbi:MAG: TolC family outer membrane protein [Pseudomonadota bacterium]
MGKKRFALAFACGAAIVALTAPNSQAAEVERFVDVMALAYRTNPTIRAAQADFRSVKETRAQALSGALPQITASGSYENNSLTTTNQFNPALPPQTQTVDFEPRVVGVDAEQPIFTGFQNFNAIKQANARIRAGGADLVSVEQRVLELAATSYFDVIRDAKVFEANQSNVAVLTRQLEEAKVRFRVGEITKTDVAQAEARLAGARAEFATAQAQLAVSRASYQEIIGQMPGTLEVSPAMPTLPESLEEAQRLADVYAPTNVSARETEAASRRQIAIARGALAPRISLTAGYQYSEEPNFFTQDSEELRYGLRATVPIFQGGANYSRIREAKATNRADRQRIFEAERRTQSTVTGAWERLAAARVTISSARAQVSANKLALEGVRRENQVGTRTTLDVLNAEQEFLNAQVTLANAERDERAAAFGLLSASGLLTLDALSVPVEAGDANATLISSDE